MAMRHTPLRGRLRNADFRHLHMGELYIYQDPGLGTAVADTQGAHLVLLPPVGPTTASRRAARPSSPHLAPAPTPSVRPVHAEKPESKIRCLTTCGTT